MLIVNEKKEEYKNSTYFSGCESYEKSTHGARNIVDDDVDDDK